MGSEREETRDGGTLPFLCECGDVGCERCVPLTPPEYRELEEKPPHLALAPGHGLERGSGSRQRDRR
jgi:hypothetical protein